MNWSISVTRVGQGRGFAVEVFGDERYEHKTRGYNFDTKREADMFALSKFKEIAIRFNLISKEYVI